MPKQAQCKAQECSGREQEARGRDLVSGEGVSCRSSPPSLGDHAPRAVDLDPSATWGSAGLETGSVCEAEFSGPS